tara:strand:+ start:1086 stop:1967 length:882 start_codon:yes stop_codon:yes gene_type:complete
MSLPTLNPTNLTEAMEFSKFLATSTHIPKDFQGNPNNILVAIQWGYEIGLAPMQALQNIAVINGRPSLWGDSMIAVCKAHPDWRGISETYIEEEDKAVCLVKRNVHGEIEETRSEFSYKDAQRANLTNKPGPWKNYPKRMLQLRARGFALRDAFPDAIKGLITAEEAIDYPEKKEPRNVTESSKDTDVIDDIKKQVKSLEKAETDVKYIMHFIGDHQPIVYSNPSDFILKFSDTLDKITKLDKPSDMKKNFFRDLRQKNSETISKLDPLEQSELDMMVERYSSTYSDQETNND